MMKEATKEVVTWFCALLRMEVSDKDDLSNFIASAPEIFAVLDDETERAAGSDDDGAGTGFD